MLVDSHCHLNFPELKDNLADFLKQMAANQVSHALCVATRPENIPEVVDLATSHANLFAAVGVHPDEKDIGDNFSLEFLAEYLSNSKVVAVGETGLDYYWNKDSDMSWQHERFAVHIQAAKHYQLPLVVHNREASLTTLQMLKDHDIRDCGAVIHCFTENIEWARKFLDIGCYISLSGIVTFKNAAQIQEVARYVPLERLLVETDAPYLAPVPMRGKLNHPALVRHTAEFIANLRQTSLEALAAATTHNFFTLFNKARQAMPAHA
jgi:TatD DNase family protein